MISLLLGAGFSKWAADLPVAAGLFDFEVDSFGPRERARLELVREIKRDWDEKHPQAYSEQFIEYILVSRNEEAKRAVLWYVVRRLSEPYIWREWHAGRRRRHVLMIDEHRKFDTSGVRAAQTFLSKFMTQFSGIITTNYDLLVEYALGTSLFNYGHQGEHLTGRGAYPISQWKNPVVLKGIIPLAKVHGSISWDADGRYTDGRRGLTGNALIIAPTPEKKPPGMLRREWKLAAHILRNSSRVLVFGFAFNPYDEALLDHLQNNGRNIQKVMLVDISPRLDRAKKIWPHAEVSSSLPPPDGKEELDLWVRDSSR
jgi:hypothetical protein